MEYMSY